MAPPDLPKPLSHHEPSTTLLPKPHHHHTLTLSPSPSPSSLRADGHPFLLDVPTNVTLSPSASPSSAFLGFSSSHPSHRHVFPLGRLVGVKFTSVFRFKVWWTTLWTGSRGRDLESETQFLLLDRSEDRPYVLVLPIIEAQFRTSIQPGAREDDYVDICAESGSTHVCRAAFRSLVYVKCGWDPFELLRDGVGEVGAHLGTFRVREEKSPPPLVGRFGWCTWDAFYLNVHPEGVWDGVRGLAEGGCPPGFVLVDDGWQSICHDHDDPSDGQEGMNRTSAGEQMSCRLIRFEENYKFRDYVGKRGGGRGMAAFTRDLKEEFPTVKQIYVWHALCGYWGGVRPGMEGLPAAKMVQPRLSPGLEKTMEDLAVDKIVSSGIGLVSPERAMEMYEGLHGHLADVGIDGVKIDVIHLLEMLCEDYGGRVDLAKNYYAALTESVRRHFHGNGVIASMEQCNDFMLLGTEAISLGRVGDDFWCTDPAGDPFWLQGCHMVHCAYNSLWIGNFIHPDWDMFQSTHPCAWFHAASRAISGGPIYVSDSVGQHDFGLLRSIALPDSTILLCQHYALPTRDCLFSDPLHDGTTMLKIWNLNKFTGVLGAFNCQGGGWCRETRRNKPFPDSSRRVKTTARPSDIEWRWRNHQFDVDGATSFAVYRSGDGKATLMEMDECMNIELEPLDFELLTVSPVRTLATGAAFAPVGLVNMLNTGGAIETLDVDDAGDREKPVVGVGIRGAGVFQAFSSAKPAACRVNGEEVEFEYEGNLISLRVPWPGKLGLSTVQIVY